MFRKPAKHDNSEKYRLTSPSSGERKPKKKKKKLDRKGTTRGQVVTKSVSFGEGLVQFRGDFAAEGEKKKRREEKRI